jgi:hypothetical protein
MKGDGNQAIRDLENKVLRLANEAGRCSVLSCDERNNGYVKARTAGTLYDVPLCTAHHDARRAKARKGR